jgi:hypothetical protein
LSARAHHAADAKIVIVTHYAPIETVEGERPEIFPFLGRSGTRRWAKSSLATPTMESSTRLVGSCA